MLTLSSSPQWSILGIRYSLMSVTTLVSVRPFLPPYLFIGVLKNDWCETKRPRVKEGGVGRGVVCVCTRFKLDFNLLITKILYGSLRKCNESSSPRQIKRRWIYIRSEFLSRDCLSYITFITMYLKFRLGIFCYVEDGPRVKALRTETLCRYSFGFGEPLLYTFIHKTGFRGRLQTSPLFIRKGDT